jgi:hypothetical protein
MTSSSGITDQQRAKIRRHLERILASPQFRNSKRYPNLLQHVVERTLDGDADSLKERAIGVDVFGREPDYDTNIDHVVRTTAGEVRKRLAQYYQEGNGHAGEIRIDLPAGSYVPLFRWPEADSPSGPPPAPEVLRFRPSRRWWLYLAALGCILCLGIAVIWRSGAATRESAMSRFWGPVWASANPVVLCVGSQNVALAQLSAPDANLLPAYLPPLTDLLSIDDAVTLARLSGFVQANGKQFHILTESQATLSDLRGGPAVLIGGFNNYWTFRFAGELRFSFTWSAAGHWRYGIVDRKDPSRQDWIMDYEAQSPGLRRDYAIITRFIDPTTEQVTVVAGGRTRWGTLAAGEFLTNPSYMAKVEPVAPRGWEHRNLQLVIATDIIRGMSGPPSIVASQFW